MSSSKVEPSPSNDSEQGLPPPHYYPSPPMMMQQQQQQQQTTVIVNQPQATQKGQPQNVRGWSTGLCGCCEDCGGCMYCFFCHACFMCTLATRMDECYCGPLCCGSPFVIPMRTKIRAQYGISGSICEDIVCIACCDLCATHQMYRELNNIGKMN